MAIRTEDGFLYEDGTFTSFEEAAQELANGWIECDEYGTFTPEEWLEQARAEIAECENGSYL